MVLFDRLRYYIVFLLGIGVFLTMCYRISFAIVLTHTTRPNVSSVEELSLYPNCTTFNNSDRDYANSFSEETGIQFHTSYYVGLFVASIGHSSIGVSVIRFSQGVLEGFIHPTVTLFVNSWSLKHEKSTLMAIAYFGIQLGPAFSNIFISACLCYVSWHSGIYILGALGTLWSVLWFLVASPTLKESRFVGRKELELIVQHGEGVMKGSKMFPKHTRGWLY
ncbi:hypothetical protein Btru_053881 [Bulinus truncatus]|nr:hypothetical protein Btru_053881 [Bulinus truncatus]